MKKIKIKFNEEWNEFRVPTNVGTLYYTDDKRDAIDTAKAEHGHQIKVKIVKDRSIHA